MPLAHKHRAAFFVLICMAMSACEPSASIEGEVIKVQRSRDGRAIATLSKAVHGATVSDVYRVYLSSVGSGSASEVIRADKVERMDVEWSGATTLSVRMECGRVFQFTNFLYVADANGNPELISIALSTAGPCSDNS